VGPKIVDVVPEMRRSGHVVDGEESHLGGIGEEESSFFGDGSDVDLEALMGVFWFTCLDQRGWIPPGPLVLSYEQDQDRRCGWICICPLC
jgi:hypothetical protein